MAEVPREQELGCESSEGEKYNWIVILEPCILIT